MSIPIYGMADHQVSLYEKNDLESGEKLVIFFLLDNYFSK